MENLLHKIKVNNYYSFGIGVSRVVLVISIDRSINMVTFLLPCDILEKQLTITAFYKKYSYKPIKKEIQQFKMLRKKTVNSIKNHSLELDRIAKFLSNKKVDKA